MAYKDIIVFVDAPSASMHRLRIAADLARRSMAHLIGIYVVPDNIDHHSHDGFARGQRAVRQVLERHRSSQERAILQAGRQFADLVGDKGIQAELRLVWNTESDRNVLLNSFYADLVIVGQTEPRGLPEHWLPEHLLLATGVPMLIVPNNWTSDSVGTRILIAWNASKEARRAATDALPLLSEAELVKILVVDPNRNPGRHGEEPGANIALHLARHGAPVDVEQLESDGASIADAVVNAAIRHNADLIVMGVYSHGRSRQLLFGSVTRAVLKNTTVPVLISH
ncbi:universal stress protein [Aquibium sp. LZ166]|uniref:Universal stress protein n=1 Tax=Aquibium pacificus TaxID=3153579 RepID=A0ABV3SPD1_9HYPH